MNRRRHRLPDVSPELMARVIALLAEDTRASRLAAAQILADGYDRDETARLDEVPLADRPDGYDELLAVSLDGDH